MIITFADKSLEKLSNDYKKCIRNLGEKRAKLYILRLNALKEASTLEDMRYLPGNYHELIGNRKGQWSCSLDHPYRLIFEPHEIPIPMNEHGQYIWSKIVGINILEITDYHK